MKIIIEIPNEITVTGTDVLAAAGACIESGKGWVDWEALMSQDAETHNKAISAPGVILLKIATELTEQKVLLPVDELEAAYRLIAEAFLDDQSVLELLDYDEDGYGAAAWLERQIEACASDVRAYVEGHSPIDTDAVKAYDEQDEKDADRDDAEERRAAMQEDDREGRG